MPMVKNSIKLVLIVLVFGSLVYLCLVISEDLGSTKQSGGQSVRYLLYWNEAYGSTEYGFCCGQKPFAVNNCPVKNCFATNNRSYFGKDGIDRFDAILFHQRSLRSDDLPQKRSPHQRYIMFMLESPSYPFGFEASEWDNFFNWTMTYRMDSDIPIPYGKIIPKENLTVDEIHMKIRDFGRDNAERYLLNKTRPAAAWFVSNCHTPGARENIVAALRSSGALEVDIFGACGDKSCPRGDREGDCWDLVERDYMFYLAFENSICADYVTEKFFNAMRRDVIPIVFGGANYSAIAPPNSFIELNHDDHGRYDVAAFTKVIKALNNNRRRFAEYFWWKEYYEIRDGPSFNSEAFCNICLALHDSTEGTVYSNLDTWWNKRSKCKKARLKSS